MSYLIPILYAALSYFLYASQAAVLEQKLGSYSTASVLIIVYLATLPLAVGKVLYMKWAGEPVVWPSSGEGLKWVLIAALVFFFADYFMIAAYTKAYSLGTECMTALVGVALLYPIFANLIKRFWVGGVELNPMYIGAYILGGLSILLVIWGTLAQNKPAAAATEVKTEVTASLQGVE